MNQFVVPPEDFARLTEQAALALSRYSPPIAQTVAQALQTAQQQPPVDGSFHRRFPPASESLRAQVLTLFDSPPAVESPLLAAATAVARQLPWRVAGGGKNPAVATVELIGPDGLAISEHCRAGLFFQPSDMFYSWHHHAAEEIYLPISGAAKWLAAGKSPVIITPMNGFSHHLSWQPHALRTDTQSLLALWGWCGDIAIESYAMCAAPNENNGKEK